MPSFLLNSLVFSPLRHRDNLYSKHCFIYFLFILLIMVLLFEIPFDNLKIIPSMLIPKLVDSLEHCGLVFDVIGCLKSFHKEKVYSILLDE